MEPARAPPPPGRARPGSPASATTATTCTALPSDAVARSSRSCRRATNVTPSDLLHAAAGDGQPDPAGSPDHQRRPRASPVAHLGTDTVGAGQSTSARGACGALGDGGRMSRLVGARVPRVEDPRLLRGRGRFVDDVEPSRAPPRRVHPEPVRARTRHGRRHDRGAPRCRASTWCSPPPTSQGVVGVMRGAGPDGLAHAVVRPAGERPRALRRRSRRARRGASRSLAEDACELVEVRYDPLPVRSPTSTPRWPPAHPRSSTRSGTTSCSKATGSTATPTRMFADAERARPLALLPAPPVQRAARGSGRPGRPLPRHRRPHLPRRAPEPARPPPVRRRAARPPRAPVPRAHRRRRRLVRAEGLRQPRGRRAVRGRRRCSVGR